MTGGELFDMAAKTAEANAKAHTSDPAAEYVAGASGRRTLREISKDFWDIGDMLDAMEDGEEVQVSAAMAERLDGLGMEMEQKMQSCGLYLIQLEADEKMYKDEEARVKRLRVQAEKQTEWFRNYMHHAMEAAHLDKVKGLCVVSFRKCNPSVGVTDIDALSEADEFGEFVKIPDPTPQPDKAAILKHFKDTGEVLPGCVINTEKRSLQVK